MVRLVEPKWLGCALFTLLSCGRVDAPGRGQSPEAGGAGAGAAGGPVAAAPSGGSAGASSVGSDPLPPQPGGAGGSAGSAGTAAFGGAPVAGGASEGGAGGEPAAGPRPYRAIQIATGRLHSCALLEDHRMKCWGENGGGELGLGDMRSRGLDPSEMGDALPFVDLGTGRTAKAIAAGQYTTCALLDDDSVKCWGMPLLRPAPDGRIGDYPGEMGDNLAPVPLGDGHTAKAVAISAFEFGCIVREDDSLRCTGIDVPAAPGVTLLSVTGSSQPVGSQRPNCGVLGLYDDGAVRVARADSLTGPTLYSNEVAGGVLTMAGSRQLDCFGLEGGKLVCAGSSGSLLPSTLEGVRTMSISEAGDLCAALADGTLRCFGAGVGNYPWGGPFNPDHEVVVPMDGNVVQLSSGAREHHCALLDNGSVVCWQLGDQECAALGRKKPGKPPFERVDLGTYLGP